jgi:hypothetical protein
MNLLESYQQTYDYDTGNNLTHIALAIINIVLCGVAFVWFAELIKGVVVVPM